MGKSKTRPHEIHLRLNEEEYQALETNRKNVTCHSRRICASSSRESNPKSSLQQNICRCCMKSKW